MEREILFRGKVIEVDNNGYVKLDKWVYGFPCKVSNLTAYMLDGANYAEHDNNHFLLYGNRVAIDTIGQYTGLKDAEENRIFEGDIVEDASHGNRMVVLFSGYGFKMRDTRGEDWEMSIEDYLGAYGSMKLKVIGNIHDNPELLQSSRQEVKQPVIKEKTKAKKGKKQSF